MLFGILDQIDKLLQQEVVQGTYDAISGYIAGPLRSGMILFVAMQGFRIMKGQTQGMSMAEFGWLTLKMGVIVECVLNWGVFNTWVVQIIWDTYIGLGDVIRETLPSDVGGGLGRAANELGIDGTSLDRAFLAQLEKALELTFQAPDIFYVDLPITAVLPGITGGAISINIPIPMPNLMPNVAGVIALVMTVVLFASVFVVLLYSRLGIISCLAVAPIFIALLLFEQTRTYTDSWFRGLLGFVLTPLLLMIILVFASALTGMVSYGSSGSILDLFVPVIAYALLYYGLAKTVASIPQFAHGLVGSQLTHMGGGAAESVIGKMHAAASAVAGPKGAAAGAAKGGGGGASPPGK